MKKTQKSSSSSSSRYLSEWMEWLKSNRFTSMRLEDDYSRPTFLTFRKIRFLILGVLSIGFIVFSHQFIVLMKKVTHLDSNVTNGTTQTLRTLPFRGTLLDEAGEPISTRTDVTFTLYDSLEDGNILYVGECFGEQGIEADYNGSFIIVLGSDCGMLPIPNELIANKNPLYLGIKIGTDSEIQPRYQIRSTSFSENASLLDGKSPGTGKGQIPYIDSNNSILLSDDSPQIMSTNGIFNLSGASLSLKAYDSEIGDVIILPASGRSTLFPVGKVGVGTNLVEAKLHISSDEDDIETVKIINLSDSIDSDTRTVLSLSIGSTIPNNNHFITFNTLDGEAMRQIGSIDQDNDRIVYRTSGADFAEYFSSTESIQTHLIVGLSADGVRRARKGDRLLGVVTTTAGFVGNAKETSSKYQALVGLVGQLQVLVSDESGIIEKADPVGVSSIPGVGSRYSEGDTLGFSLSALSELPSTEYSQKLCPKEFKSRVRTDGKPIKCAYIMIVLE